MESTEKVNLLHSNVLNCYVCVELILSILHVFCIPVVNIDPHFLFERKRGGTVDRRNYYKMIATHDTSNRMCELIYSVRKLFTGFISATLIAWGLIVKNATSIAPVPARKNNHKFKPILLA